MSNVVQRLYSKFDRLDVAITLILVLLFGIFIVSAPDVFLRFDIYRSFMTTLPYIGILALAVTFIVTLGEIDLSFPSVMALSAWAFAKTFEMTGSASTAFVVSLIAGASCGAVNGAIITLIGVPSIVATIGTMFVWRGLVNVLAEGKGIPVVELAETTFRDILVGRIFGEIPMQFVWFIIAAIVLIYIYRRHVFGTHVLFVGDNKVSAHMMGINVNLVRMLCYIFMGVASAFAGVLLVSEVTYFWPSTGDGFLLPALAAVFVGGTSVFGGRGSMYGTLAGVFVIGSLEAGIVAMGLKGFYTQLIYGLLITLAVCSYTIFIERRR